VGFKFRLVAEILFEILVSLEASYCHDMAQVSIV